MLQRKIKKMNLKEFMRDYKEVFLNKTDFVVIAGDINDEIDKDAIPLVIGAYGENTLHNNGRRLREFKCKLTNMSTLK